MSLKQWALLIACVAVVGIARVAQQTTLRLKAYDVGARLTQVHELENRTQWMEAQVDGAHAPLHLARIARQRKLELVAWSAMPVPVAMIGRTSLPAPAMMAGTISVTGRPQPVRLASNGQDD